MVDIEILFEPGYSIKYDPITGRMSTGIGLSHGVSAIKSMQEKYKMAEAIYTFESVMKSMNISRQSGPVKKVEEYDKRTKLKKYLHSSGY